MTLFAGGVVIHSPLMMDINFSQNALPCSQYFFIIFAIIGNRSATFFEMGEWKKCLDDIDGKNESNHYLKYLKFIRFGYLELNVNIRFLFTALLEFYEYPKEMNYKIYDRKGRSLLELSKSESKNNQCNKLIS